MILDKYEENINNFISIIKNFNDNYKDIKQKCKKIYKIKLNKIR